MKKYMVYYYLEKRKCNKILFSNREEAVNFYKQSDCYSTQFLIFYNNHWHIMFSKIKRPRKGGYHRWKKKD